MFLARANFNATKLFDIRSWLTCSIQRSNENTRGFWQQIWVFKNWQNEKSYVVKCKILVLCKCNGRKNLTLGDNRETRQCSHFSKASTPKNIVKCFLFLQKKIFLAMQKHYLTIWNTMIPKFMWLTSMQHVKDKC